tara:strand:- start:4645 stop:5511 length:867 start_codon:yes stop_codon:yes gene_type:complete
MGEQQYIDLIKDIITNGEYITGRNGGTIAVFGRSMRFSLDNNTIPILTSKKVAWKTCIKELLWFISGSTDNNKLKAEKVHIWNDNASREYLDSIGLQNREEDDLGPVYGHQWRHFNAPYTSCHSDYTGKGIDQLNCIIETLKDKEKRSSRRLILSAWNPCQLDEMALPPCHVLAQFNVINNKLSCALYQRSCDVGLGVPFNILSYSVLTHLLAKHCDLNVGEFVYFLGNTHIYDDHVEMLKEQLHNTLYKFPTINIKNKYDNIEDYKIGDFEINDYKCNAKIYMKMRK